MKKMIAALVLVAVSLLPARAFAQATHDHLADSPKATIVVSQPLVVGTTILQPGEYKFQCRTFNNRTFLVVTVAETGKELYSSGDQIKSFNHFTGLSVANGRVYITTYDSVLYCFGLRGSL